jgi:hypothetical protein
VHDGWKVADQDRDFPSYETAPQDLVSYPHLVVYGSPSDRSSAVVSPTLPVVRPDTDDELSAVDFQVSIAPSTAIVAVSKRPRHDLQNASTSGSQELLSCLDSQRVSPLALPRCHSRTTNPAKSHGKVYTRPIGWQPRTREVALLAVPPLLPPLACATAPWRPE